MDTIARVMELAGEPHAFPFGTALLCAVFNLEEYGEAWRPATN